jgi:outer membrane protein
MKAYVLTTAALAALTMAGAARADNFDWNSGWSVGAGIARIHLQSTSDDISGPFTPAGLEVSVKDATTLFLSLDKQINPRFDVELAGGWPPTHNVNGKGPATVGSVPYDGVTLSKAKEMAPTLLVNYSFTDAGQPLRPYIGLGLNYTHFYDIKSTTAGDNVNGGPTSTSMKDSYGLAGQIGLRWQLQNQWSMNAAILKANVKSNFTADTSGIDRTTHINFNPTVFVLALYYAF